MNRIIIITAILVLAMSVSAFAATTANTDVSVTTDAYATITAEANSSANVSSGDYAAGHKYWHDVDACTVVANGSFHVSVTFSQLTNSTCTFKVGLEGGTPQNTGGNAYTGAAATNRTLLDQDFYIDSLSPVSLDDDHTHTTTVTYTIAQP